MKKRVFSILLISVTIAVVVFLFRNATLYPVLYANNRSFSNEENQKIKSLLLNAVRDRCLIWCSLDKSDIYNMDYQADIVQFDDSAQTPKQWLCFIDPYFMHTARKVRENEYDIVIKIHYPENYYYHFSVKNIDGIYRITSFQIDI